LAAWPDLTAETDRENAEYEYIASVIDRYLDAEEDTWDARSYEQPDSYIMDKPGALVQLIQSYFVAKRKGAPEFNLELLRNYMLQLSDAIDRANEQEQAAQQNGAGPPAGVSPPSAPGAGPAPTSPTGPMAVPSAA
jgi:hypothetical protein